MIVKDLIGDFFSMVFPKYCLTCSKGLWKGEDTICTVCRANLPKTNTHQIEIDALSQKFWGKVSLVYTLAYLRFSKKGITQKLLHELKYKNRPDIGFLLGKWYGVDLREAGFNDKFDIIIPIPLHKEKKKKRGYNQSDYFAEGLSDTMKIEWSANVMSREVDTKTQTKKGRMERWENVESIFEIIDAEKIRDKNVLLVDDVVTTGSTLEAGVRALYEAGAKSVSIGVIAYA